MAPLVITRRVVVEADGPGFVAMDGDGCVTSYPTREAVLRAIKRADQWESKRNAAIVVTEIEWRA